MSGKHRKPRICPYTWTRPSRVHDHHHCGLRPGHTGNHLCGEWNCTEEHENEK